MANLNNTIETHMNPDYVVSRIDDVVFTCGLCETILTENEAQVHDCFEGFTQVHQDVNHYLYPICENGTIVRRSLVQGNEMVTQVDVSTLQQNANKEVSEFCSTDQGNSSFEEHLISLVNERSSLWNIRLPPAARTKSIKDKLWLEIAKILNLDVNAIKKKWKNLTDYFNKIVASEKSASGSASQKKKPWMHYQAMLFLKDVTLQNKQTYSNMVDAAAIGRSTCEDEFNNVEENELDESSSSSLDINNSSNNNKRKRKNTLVEAAEVLANALIQPNVNEAPTVSAAPKMSETAVFAQLLDIKLQLIEDKVLKRSLMRQIIELIDNSLP